jgi:N-carbamoyl-L-amino-acid hydrolase
MLATVGEIQNHPNSRNIIPDRVHFTVDFRAWEEDIALQAWDLLCEGCQGIADRYGCPARFEKTWHVDRSSFDKKLVQRVLDVATEFGYSNMVWVSGARHDASYTNPVCPTAMIFVPSIGGRSHVEVENTRWEECEAGCNVLLHCLLRGANELEQEK